MPEYLKALLTIAATFALFSLGALFIRVDLVLSELPDRVDRRIEQESREARELTERIAGKYGDALVAELHGARGDLRAAVPAITGSVDVQGAMLTSLIDQQLQGVRADLQPTLTQTAKTLAGIEILSRQADMTVQAVNAGLPYYLDCTSGQCLPNHLYGMAQETEKAMRATRKTMEAVETAAPPTTMAIASTSHSIDLIAGKFAADKPWWKKALSAVGLAGVAVGHIF